VSITTRNLDPAIKELLRVRAAEHGHSMEAEVRRILQTSLQQPERPLSPARSHDRLGCAINRRQRGDQRHKRFRPVRSHRHQPLGRRLTVPVSIR
jgi:plasmid stability protein